MRPDEDLEIAAVVCIGPNSTGDRVVPQVRGRERSVASKREEPVGEMHDAGADSVILSQNGAIDQDPSDQSARRLTELRGAGVVDSARDDECGANRTRVRADRRVAQVVVRELEYVRRARRAGLSDADEREQSEGAGERSQPLR